MRETGDLFRNGFIWRCKGCENRFLWLLVFGSNMKEGLEF